jgi:uncharacterized YigZ family protein
MDTYITIKSPAEGYYTEKRSKFYAFIHPVSSAEEVKELNAHYRKKYYDARHVCYAYRLGPDGALFRANDDGEPSSTAGKPILGVLLSANVTDAVIFVIRYYGGVNLGTGGLIVAYRAAAADALAHAEQTEKIVERQLTHSFTYPEMNAVMKIVKDMQLRVVSQDFGSTTCSITLAVRLSDYDTLRARLQDIRF